MTPSRHRPAGPRKRPSQSSAAFLAENTIRGAAPADCWQWQGGPDAYGYGRIPVDGKRWFVHRYAYVLSYGPIPDGFDVDHKCHNDSGCAGGHCDHRRCVNPDHLEAVEPVVNRHRSHLHHANRTHCPKNHPYDEENTNVRKLGNGKTGRFCKACAREWDQKPERLARSAERRRKGPRPKPTHCPLAHPLGAPNARRSDGGCLACHRARSVMASRVKQGIAVDLQALADEKYAAISAVSTSAVSA